MLFQGDASVTATAPADVDGFALRDDSLELQRLFLHAISRFGSGAAVYVERDRQKPLAGMSGTAGRSDLVFARLSIGARTVGVVCLLVGSRPKSESLDALCRFCELAARLLDMDAALTAARRQSRDGRLLAMVNERLHKSLDRRDVLFGIVEGVRSSFGADRCIVYQRSPDGEHVSVAAVAAQGSTASLPAGAVPLDADLRKVFGGLTVRRDDVEGGMFFGGTARGALAVPFVVDGSVEDALVLSFDRPRAFDDADVTAVRSLAFHVGLALSNARLYERERARRRQAESLERVVRILRDTQYVDEVLLVFVVTVSHELPVDCAAYSLENDELVRRALRMREQRSPAFETRVPRHHLEPFLAVDEPSDAMLLPRSVRSAFFESRGGVVVPLRLDGALWGMLVVRSAGESGPAWSADERVTFFRTLGSHLEIALANAHAYERELRRGRERETLAEAARTILSHRSLGPLAAVMCRLAAALVQASGACVLSWSDGEYVRAASYGEDVEKLIAQSGFDVAHRVERLPGMPAQERRVQRLIDGPGYVVIPLSSTAADDQSETIDAFLLVAKPDSERFGREDLRLLQELGALLALALQNIELYEATMRANHALQESSQFKDDLLAMLAHDFKGPLTVILGCCELMLEDGREGPDEIETVFAQTQRLLRLSEDALVLAQTQAEGFSLARSVVDLGAFVVDCVEETAPNNSRLIVEVPPDPVMVELDPQRFRHVIDNLVSNALKYSDAQARVSVRTQGSQAIIDVQDEGIGIPENELQTLFTRFGRASNARQRGIAGSGIGLYVARKIVEVHRGTLTVQSKENQGSTFRVTLPLAPPPA